MPNFTELVKTQQLYCERSNKRPVSHQDTDYTTIRLIQRHMQRRLALPFGPNSALFAQPSRHRCIKTRRSSSQHGVWVVQRPDDNTYNAGWHRKRAAEAKGGTEKQRRERRRRKMCGEIERKLSNAVLICHA